MILRRLGVWYLGSSACRMVRNPLSSTSEAGCRSTASIITRLSSSFLQQVNSLEWTLDHSEVVSRLTCLDCSAVVHVCPCSTLRHFASSCCAWTTWNSSWCLLFRCFITFEVWPEVSLQRTHASCICPTTLLKVRKSKPRFSYAYSWHTVTASKSTCQH